MTSLSERGVALAEQLSSVGGAGGAEARALHLLAQIDELAEPAILPDLVGFALGRSPRLVAEISLVAAGLLDQIDPADRPAYDETWRTASDARLERWNWMDAEQFVELAEVGEHALPLVSVCTAHRDPDIADAARALVTDG